MLAYQWHCHSGMPVVFLHGLLGSQQDWQSVISLLQNVASIRPLTIDLPFHGESAHISCCDFADMRQKLHQTLQHCLGTLPFFIVGYSLGGRIALDYFIHHKTNNLVGIMLEGTNIGLDNEEEKRQRWQHDLKWAEHFLTQPIEQTLYDWYQQPVFSSLTHAQKQKLIAQRKYNEKERIATMLKATSLAKQPRYYFEALKDNICFLVGEKDIKFLIQAEKNHLPYRIIRHAGHNTHWENPKAFVAAILNFIQHCPII